MLAADKMLLRSQVKQQAIALREKELNLFNSNFSAVATQAALLAGFSMAFLEMSVHLHGTHYNPVAKGLLHLFATICICTNIYVVSVITFVSVWGSGKALRGRDGSMAKVVDGMNKERWLIFITFGIGLISLLSAVACSTWLLMQWEAHGARRTLGSRGRRGESGPWWPLGGGGGDVAAERDVLRAHHFGVAHLQEV